MNYLSWTVIVFGAYSFVVPLMKVTTAGQVKIPGDVAALAASDVLAMGIIGVIVVPKQSVTDSVISPKLPYVLAAGACLAISTLSYYRALALGPTSIVAPIPGMFLVVSSVIGIVTLGEPLMVRKVTGIGFAVFTIILTSTD